MGCVQSYFRKGSYDVYEAHNAGLSPSSTQGSEHAAFGEDQAMVQENNSEAQATEVVKSLASAGQDETNTSQLKEEAALITNDNLTTSRVDGIENTEKTGDIPVVGATEVGAVTINRSQECSSGADMSIDNLGDVSHAMSETENEKVNSAKTCSSATSATNDKALTPSHGEQIDNSENMHYTSDSQARSPELSLSDADEAKGENLTTRKGREANEATILEDQSKENNNLEALNEIADQKEMTDSKPNECLPYEHLEGKIVTNEEFVNGTAVDECSEITVENSNGFSAVVPVAECKPDWIGVENVIEDREIFSAVEPGKEVIPSRPSSLTSEKIGLEDDMNLVISDETTSKNAEECSVYSYSVDSAEEALASRPISVASEKVEETAKDALTTENPLTNSREIDKESTEVHVLDDIPVITTDEKSLKETREETDENLHSVKENIPLEKAATPEEFIELAAPSKHTSNEYNTLEGLASPASTADEASQEIIGSNSCTQEDADLIPASSPNAISETKDELDKYAPITDSPKKSVKQDEWHSEILTNTNVTELETENVQNGKETFATEKPENVSACTETLECVDTSLEDSSRMPYVTENEKTMTTMELGEGKDKPIEDVSKSVEISDEVPLTTQFAAANKSSEEAINVLSPEKYLEEETLSKDSSNVSITHTEKFINDLPSKDDEKIEFEKCETIEIAKEPSENQCQFQDVGIKCTDNNVIVNSETTAKNDVTISPMELTEKSSSFSVVSEAIENHNDNLSPSESAEEITSSAPCSRVSGTVTERGETVNVTDLAGNNTEESVTSLEKPSYEEHEEYVKIITAPCSPVKNEISEKCIEKHLSEDIPQIQANTHCEILSQKNEINQTGNSLNDNNDNSERNIEIIPSVKTDANENTEVSKAISSPAKFIDDTTISTDSENVTEDCMEPCAVISDEDNLLHMLFNNTNIDNNGKETAQSENVNDINMLTLKSDVETDQTDGTENCTQKDLCEYSNLAGIENGSINITTHSPNLGSAENITVQSGGNEVKEESTTGCASITSDSSEGTMDQTYFNQKAVNVEECMVDNDLSSKEKENTVPFINEIVDGNPTEGNGFVENDTEEVDKEDSTIASIPESIMTVPESMGDMELSSESSMCGPIEKSIEETRSEEIKPDEPENSSLVANLTDDICEDIATRSSASENDFIEQCDSLDRKNEINIAIDRNGEDENTGKKLYADAFGRPVPTINLIESEEQKRSDSEEDNFVTVTPENELKEQVSENQEVEVRETIANDTCVESNQEGIALDDREGKESSNDSVIESDSSNLLHKEYISSGSSNSRSGTDSIVAEKGSDVESIVSVSADPSSDAVRVITDEEKEANFEEPATIQLPDPSDMADEVQQAAFTKAATTIQASFRGYQARQDLQKSVSLTKDSAEELEESSADQLTSKNLIISEAKIVPGSSSMDESKFGEVSPVNSESSSLPEPVFVDRTEERITDQADAQTLQEPHQPRDELVADKDEGLSSGDQDSSLSSAATKIQSSFRGYMTRKHMRETTDDSTVISLTNEPSIPNSQQSFGTFSTSNEDNGVRTSGSLETAVQKQQQSTLDEIEEQFGSGHTFLMDVSMNQVNQTNILDDYAVLESSSEAPRGPSPENDTATTKSEAVPSPPPEKPSVVNEEDQNVWVTLEKELSEAATKIQSNYRGYRDRQKLRREDAVQMPTTSTSSAASAASDRATDTEVRASGEFHDMMVLPQEDITNLTNCGNLDKA